MKKKTMHFQEKLHIHIKTRISQLWYRIYSKWILISELTKKKLATFVHLDPAGLPKAVQKEAC